MTKPIYDRIGKRYAELRQPEPSWERQIWEALDVERGGRILNVGAGTGSYEPVGAIALEPSTEMISQRHNSNPVIQGVAERIPFADNSFDAVMAILTVHHWSDRTVGLRELRRVAQRQVVFVFEPLLSHRHWILDYVPEIANNEVEQNAPTPETLAEHLNVLDVQTVWIPGDCLDGAAAAYWKRPKAYLRPEVRQSMSALALLDEAIRKPGIDRLRRDLDNGTWHLKYGHLLDDDRADYGYRLVLASG